MNNALYNFQGPENEPVFEYLKGSKERTGLENELRRQENETIEIPLIIDGKEVYTGKTGYVTAPHNHQLKLARYHKAGEKEVEMAIEAARKAHRQWANLPWNIRSSILLKAAELISSRHRALINASTMLGQSKNIYQSEIDAVCQNIEFLK